MLVLCCEGDPALDVMPFLCLPFPVPLKASVPSATCI